MLTDRSIPREQLIQELAGVRTQLAAKEQQCRELTQQLTQLKSKKLPASERRVRTACRKLSERKQAAEVMRRQEQLLDIVMRTTDVMLVLLDPQFNFVWVNPAYAATCQMRPEEMVGKNHFVLYPHAENEEIFRKVRDTGEGIFYKDKPFIFPDQPEREVTYWDWSLTPVKDPIGKVTGLVYSLRETTKFKRAEDELRKKEAELREAQRLAHVGSWYWNAQTDEINGSEEMLRIYGFDPATQGMPNFRAQRERCYPVEDWEWLNEAVQRAMETGVGYELDVQVLRNGTRLWVTTRSEAVRDAEGRIVGLRGTVQDITERKRAQEAIAQSERRFRALTEKTAEIITVLDATGIITYNITGANSKLGYAAEELVGRNAFELVHPDDLRRVAQLFQEGVPQLGKVEQAEFRFRAKDGSWRWQFAMGTNLLYDPAVGGILVNSRDITERKQAEESLRHLNETLEQRVAERTELAEARSRQLQALAMELIEAEERERRRIAELLHDDLQQILAAARMQLQAVCETIPSDPILASVEQLLEESIGKSRRLSHELSPAVLHQSGLVAALQWLAQQMGNQFGLSVQLETDWPKEFESAPVKVFLFRAVQELLFNVVKHAGVKSAQVVLSGSDSSVTATVSDQGLGLNPDILNFPTSAGGLGLLSLRERARHIGGSLEIESAPGQGSRFTLTVPLSLAKADWLVPMAAAPKPVTHSETLVSAGAGGLRVLFADDHQVMRNGLIKLMDSQPDIHVVGQASNGREAVEPVRQLKPDVVVMDVSMPEMDGIEATRRIKAELPEVRVIGLSMHDDEQIARSMREVGAESYLTKTAPAAELLKAIYGVDRK